MDSRRTWSVSKQATSAPIVATSLNGTSTAKDQGLARAIGVPHPRRLVLGRGDDALAVGAERRRLDPVLVTPKDQGLARAVGVPHPRGLVGGRGDDALAVGAERRRTDPILVAPKDQGSPVPSAFHTRAVLSHDAVTMRLPSGLNAAEKTASS